MFNTYYLGKVKKQFWATMDDHIGARVVFRFFFPLLKVNARRIKDAYAMANFIDQSTDYISPVQRYRIRELKSHLLVSLTSNPNQEIKKQKGGFPPHIFDFELDEDSVDE